MNEPVVATVKGNAYRDPKGRHAPTYGDPISVTVELRFGYDRKLWWFVTEGAVTGYESVSAKDLEKENVRKPGFPDGWSACAGTPGRWASLVVTGPTCMAMLEEQRKVGVTHGIGQADDSGTTSGSTPTDRDL